MANENIEVGTRAVAKVGRNENSVEVIAVENGSFLVRNDAGREFHVAHLTLPDEAAFCEDDAPFGLWGRCRPLCFILVLQADAFEIVVALADFRVVCLDRFAVIGSLLFLFFASHANHLGVEH